MDVARAPVATGTYARGGRNEEVGQARSGAETPRPRQLGYSPSAPRKRRWRPWHRAQTRINNIKLWF